MLDIYIHLSLDAIKAVDINGTFPVKFLLVQGLLGSKPIILI